MAMRSLTVLITLTVATAAFAADWPQWRGPDRTEVSKETGLLKAWPSEGPKLLWHVKTLGVGHAGPAIVGDRIYVLGDREKGEELICLNTKDGSEVWSAKVGNHYDNKWGAGPRSTPAVDGKLVYAIGSQGNLVAVSAANGKVVWQQQLSGQVQSWGFTQSPLVDDKLVYAYEGGNGSIVAFDKMRGKQAWKSENFKDASHYSSLIKIEDSGLEQIVQLRNSSVVSVAAKNGKTVWKTDWPGKTAVIPTPIYEDGKVFVSSGYGVGGKMFQINKAQTKDVWENKNMKNHHGSVVLIDGHLYGYSDGGGWVCLDFATGEMQWNDKSFGKGAVFAADGRLYCYDEATGTIALAEVSTSGWKEHGRFEIPAKTSHNRGDGKIWVHPVVANGVLYLRDQEHFFAYDVKAN